jgi:glycosyltransferase involved in cell wall biosynthesis
MAGSAFNKAVWLTSECPYPVNSGGKLRETSIIRLLMERMEVEVLCFPSPVADPSGAPQDLKITEIERRRAPFWKRAVYPLRPYVVNGYSQTVEGALRERAEPGKLLWISRLGMAQYLPVARELGYRVVLDEQNVESNLLLNGALEQISEGALSSLRAIPSLLRAAQCTYYEGQFCAQSDAIVATSDIDASKLHKLAPEAKIHVIPNSLDCGDYQPLRAQPGKTLFFSGTLDYYPNIEGLHWFTREILPRIRSVMGSGMPRVVVAGKSPSAELTSLLSDSGIELYSNPPSILPFLSESAVVFVPLRSGSGTRLKILEAMAAGRAVVSTGKGAEGLVLAPSYDIWIADRTDAFASAICRLLKDQTLREEMGARAALTAEQRYDWRQARTVLDELLSALEAPPRRATR